MIITRRIVKQIILKNNENQRTIGIVASKGLFATNFQLNVMVPERVLGRLDVCESNSQKCLLTISEIKDVG